MSYVDKRLLKAAANAGNKLAIAVGDSIKVTYIGYEPKMDEKYQKLRYHFKFKLQDGTEKVISTSAARVLKKMARIAPGSVLEITKLGDQQQTDYEFVVLSQPKAPISQPEEVIEQDEPEDQEEDEEEDEDDEKPLKANF